MLDKTESLASIYSGTVMTKGIQIAKGAGQAVEIDLFSDGEAPAWTVDAQDVAAYYGSPELSFQWDATTGTNGNKLHLTITRVANGTQFAGSEFVLSSKQGDKVVSQWWGYVAN